MPQLKSGRHVALSVIPYIDLLGSSALEDTRRFFAIVVMRLNIGSALALRDHALIGSFGADARPPDGPVYYSGCCVADVLAGRSDFSPDEIAEFAQWLESEPRMATWLQQQFEDINIAIQECSVWNSSLLADDVAALIKRTLIEKAALEPGSMQQLRSVIAKAES
ncbi:MAG: hypothetical protein JSR27_10040 [Proteobacteria bacterium]|nr:hypothetical protein [Pseudomonadota bacterium]